MIFQHRANIVSDTHLSSGVGIDSVPLIGHEEIRSEQKTTEKVRRKEYKEANED